MRKILSMLMICVSFVTSVDVLFAQDSTYHIDDNSKYFVSYGIGFSSSVNTTLENITNISYTSTDKTTTMYNSIGFSGKMKNTSAAVVEAHYGIKLSDNFGIALTGRAQSVTTFKRKCDNVEHFALTDLISGFARAFLSFDISDGLIVPSVGIGIGAGHFKMTNDYLFNSMDQNCSLFTNWNQLSNAGIIPKGLNVVTNDRITNNGIKKNDLLYRLDAGVEIAMYPKISLALDGSFISSFHRMKFDRTLRVLNAKTDIDKKPYTPTWRLFYRSFNVLGTMKFYI
jgi:hypothetical protein